MKQRRGFTAVEVLVAVVCLVVIFVVFMPVYGGSHRPAQKTTCLSNMKQTSVALLIYLEDNDHFYPQSREAEPDWITRIQTYSKSYTTVHCPSDEKTVRPLKEGRGIPSYSLNGSATRGLKQTSLIHPESWIVVAERNNVTQPETGPWTFTWWTWTSRQDLENALATGRHAGSANYGFGDGHVKGIKPEQLLAEGLTKPFEPRLKPTNK